MSVTVTVKTDGPRTRIKVAEQGQYTKYWSPAGTFEATLTKPITLTLPPSRKITSIEQLEDAELSADDLIVATLSKLVGGDA